MKKTVSLIFILFSLISFSKDSEKTDKESKFKFDYKLSVGIMVGHENNLYKTGGEKDYNFNPFIEFEVNDIYISGSEIGYTYYLNERTSITVLTQLSGGLTLQGVGSAFGGSKLKGSKMEDGYKGIDDRESQIEVGLKINYETDYHELELSGEIQGGKRGSTAKASVSRILYVNEKVFFLPEFTFTLIGENLVNNYFGVTESEAMNSQNYKIDKSYQTNELGHAFSIGLTGVYDINSKWSAFALSEVQYLSDNISDSPLVKNKTNYFVGAGLRYRFK